MYIGCFHLLTFISDFFVVLKINSSVVGTKIRIYLSFIRGGLEILLQSQLEMVRKLSLDNSVELTLQELVHSF